MESAFGLIIPDDSTESLVSFQRGESDKEVPLSLRIFGNYQLFAQPGVEYNVRVAMRSPCLTLRLQYGLFQDSYHFVFMKKDGKATKGEVKTVFIEPIDKVTKVDGLTSLKTAKTAASYFFDADAGKLHVAVNLVEMRNLTNPEGKPLGYANARPISICLT